MRLRTIPFFLVAGLLLATIIAPSARAWDEDQDSSKAEAATQAASDDAEPAALPANPFPDAVTVSPGILDGGSEWLNTSAPIDLKDLRGKVVLLDFWTYCCINCIHVLPDLKFLEEKYEKELVVIGVHSAKFENEKLSENIRDAILRYEIKHPVVNDNEMLIWRKFGTRSWPTLALIDPEGRFIGSQGGEGNRELFDAVISKIVKYHRAKSTLDETPLVFDLEANNTEPTSLRYPGKLLADAESNRLFISDSNHNRIVVTDLNGNLLHTIGKGTIGSADGDFDRAEFDHPQGMELVGETLYVADTENHLIRVIDLEAETVSTLAGTGKQGRPRDVNGDLKKTKLNSPWDLLHIDGTLFIAMAGPHQIWSHEIGSDTIGVHAGNAREDIINGRLSVSSFAQPSGLTANGDGTLFFVADSEGSSIRSVPVATDGQVTTIAGTSELPRGQSLFAFGDVDAVGKDARFQHPLGVAWHDGSVYVADSYNHKIRKVDVATGEVTTWLGTGKAGDSLSPVQFSEPAGLSIAGDFLYIADTNNHRVCRANLKTKQVSVIELPDVAPPAPPKTRRVPDLANVQLLPKQTVKLGDAAEVAVELAVPAGFKLNSLAPITWEVFQIEGDQILNPTALEGRDEATADGSVGRFQIRLQETEGTATIAIEMSYGYCDTEKGNICRLASTVWKLSLEVTEDATGDTIKLAFPEK
ncbi:thioredoxin-like domain-containing protein [Fuerstiella marisgermanici]|uniref:Thiol-disulfide oxidoreductase YkuV n=1 Tax=Fuerstiella marisgermanici TaxID=1891926 RepID=A0A1P8WS68_9PLAN|nr:thioredoxin-like domain-containing protein [Fuerstiella marisgermanici]APZ96888.1 Thiol-disulfide oxidoreductase YkuV [Fuerstiella marisgermanici]